MRDFRKLGLDRVSTAIAQATTVPQTSTTSGLSRTVGGDITQGEVVEVVWTGTEPSNTNVVNIGSGKTGAIPIIQPFNTERMYWLIGTTTEPVKELKYSSLSITLAGPQTGTQLWWVF